MEEQVEMVGRAFVDHYYHLFDADRPSLPSLYQASSMMSFEGQKVQGVDAISSKLNQLPFDQCRHVISTVDAQSSPASGGVLVFVSGSLQLAGEEHLRFSQGEAVIAFWGFHFHQFAMKGISKGLNKITNIFAVKEKEKELEIGAPTDVKHVAHIGSDGDASAPPSWMGGFNSAPELSSQAVSSSTTPARADPQSSEAAKKHKKKKNKGQRDKKPKSKPPNSDGSDF